MFHVFISVGQTAPKVQNAFAEADGGTLFLDEAWALQAGHRGSGRGGDTFSAEAIATLLTELEKNRTNVFVIIAGKYRLNCCLFKLLYSWVSFFFFRVRK